MTRRGIQRASVTCASRRSLVCAGECLAEAHITATHGWYCSYEKVGRTAAAVVHVRHQKYAEDAPPPPAAK